MNRFLVAMMLFIIMKMIQEVMMSITKSIIGECFAPIPALQGCRRFLSIYWGFWNSEVPGVHRITGALEQKGSMGPRDRWIPNS